MNMKRILIGAGATLAATLAIACGVPSQPDEGYQPNDVPGSSSPEAPRKPQKKGPVDGTFKVPDQIKPGKYQAVVPADSIGCYWARLKDTSGGFNSIIANDVASANQQVRVEIRETDGYFETNGCGAWKPER